MEATIRFRAPKELKARIARIGQKRTKLPAELSREAAVEFAERYEKKLGLPPITPAEVKHFLKRAKENGVAA